jgi:PAS domain S-box-containing protein
MNADWTEMRQFMGREFIADAVQPDPAWMEKYIHPEDRVKVQKAIVDAIEGKRIFDLEHRVLRADGTIGWTASRAVPLLDAAGQITEWFGTASDISDRKRAEAEKEKFIHDLAVSERRRRLAAEAADVGSFNIDPVTSTLVSDAQFRRLLSGLNDPLTFEQSFAVVHPDDREMVRQRVAASMDPADGQPYEVEYRVIHANGEVRWIAARGGSVFAGELPNHRTISFDGTVTDVTERKRVDAELALQRHRLEVIFQALPAAMALWRSDDLIFEQVKPQYHALFPGRPLLGLPLLQALPELKGQGFDDLLRRVMHTGETFVGRETLVRLARTSDGPVEDWYFDFSYHQVKDPHGNPWGVYNHVVEVTDRVLARQARERSQEDLQKALSDREKLLASERAARGDAELAGKMKDEFLATLSHELRTPLNAIVGWTQILKASGNNPDDLAEGLAVIDRNARAQTQIIEDILDMSRIISGKLRLDVERVDISGIIRAGIDTVQPTADAKGVKLQNLLDPSAGPVSGDANRLQQIIWNLLSNAVKFTPRGGKVQVLLERVNSHVEISIIDTGEGIDPAFLPHVFDRFRQADSSTTRRHGGLGLGLAIVKQLVEMHGGSVRVKSPGKGLGSTFIVALPLTVVHPEHLDTVAPREHPESRIPLKHHSASGQLNGVDIVAVDDEPDGVAVVKRLLEECGANVRTALSVSEALELIHAQVPAVIVSDIGMPGEDGYSLIRQLRALPPERGGRVHAVALTAYARASDRVKALEAGFQMHLSKPVEPTELVVTVAALAKLGS